MSDLVPIKDYVDARLFEERAYVDKRFEGMKDAVDVALKGAAALADAANKAVDKAENQGERWRQNANEWRGAMSDREHDFLSRKEFYAIVGTAVGVVGLILTAWAIFHSMATR